MANTDVVVIGGGCPGCAISYFLTRAGLKVTLLEKSHLAAGASDHGTGISRLNFRDTDMGAHADLSRKHIGRLERIIPLLEDEAGMSVECQRAPGMTIPLTDAAWEKMQRIGKAEGHRVISGNAARELEPGLGPEIPGAVWESARRKVTAPLLTKAYAKSAEQRGARIVFDEVLGIDIKNGRVAGVRTKSGPISCGTVVIAMGMWAPKAGEWLGVKIPIKPIKGEGLRLRYDGPRAQHFLTPEGMRPGFVEQGHVIFRMDGVVSIGSTMEDVGLDETPTDAARDRILRMAIHLWPALAKAEITERIVGFRPVPADGLPILGPVPGVDGAFIIAGHSAVSRSALYAEVVRDYVVDGNSRVLPSMEPFLLERFQRDQPAKVFGMIRETKEAAPVIKEKYATA
jgi:glycine oxidase